MIERGSEKLVAPERSTLLLPYDKIFVIGTEEQLAAVKSEIETTPSNETSEVPGAFGLGSVSLRNEDPFANKTIRECGIRELLGGLVVGLERQGERILNPDLSLRLLEGDLVWVVGDLERLRAFKKHK
jgi:CPA2 family monovalent cation:H+ antiporter-2